MAKEKFEKFDRIIPFTLRKSKVRGRFVKLEKSLNGILKRHNYKPSISLFLADILSASCCIGSLLKFNGFFTIQGTSKNTLKTILADYSSLGDIRGYASYNEKYYEMDNKKLSLEQLMSKGHFAFTAIESKSNKRYQGIIPVQEGKFSKSIAYYFKNSEQTNSEIICISDYIKDNYVSAAILIQSTPEENNKFNDTKNVFEEAKIFLNSIKKTELLSKNISMENMLYNVFNSMDVRVLEEIRVKDKCRCSIDKVKTTLSNMPENELNDITFSNGSLEIKCEFCKKITSLSKEDLYSFRN